VQKCGAGSLNSELYYNLANFQTTALLLKRAVVCGFGSQKKFEAAFFAPQTFLTHFWITPSFMKASSEILFFQHLKIGFAEIAKNFL
jgi:hypothetical protein